MSLTKQIEGLERYPEPISRRDFIQFGIYGFFTLIKSVMLGLARKNALESPPPTPAPEKPKPPLPIEFVNFGLLEQVVKENLDNFRAFAGMSETNLMADWSFPVRAHYEPPNLILLDSQSSEVLVRVDVHQLGLGDIVPTQVNLSPDYQHLLIRYKYDANSGVTPIIIDQTEPVLLALSLPQKGSETIQPNTQKLRADDTLAFSRSVTIIKSYPGVGNADSTFFSYDPHTREQTEFTVNPGDIIRDGRSREVEVLAFRLNMTGDYNDPRLMINHQPDLPFCVSEKNYIVAQEVDIVFSDVISNQWLTKSNNIGVEFIQAIRIPNGNIIYKIHLCSTVDPEPLVLPNRVNTTKLIGVLPNGNFLIAYGIELENNVTSFEPNTIAVSSVNENGELQNIYLGDIATEKVDQGSRLVLAHGGLYWQNTNAIARRELILSSDQLAQASALKTGGRYVWDVSGKWVEKPLTVAESLPPLPTLNEPPGQQEV